MLFQLDAKSLVLMSNSALSKADAVLAGFDEAIVLSESGSVSEGSAMNVFMVKKGELITPSGTENILEGITRSTLIKMAEDDLKHRNNLSR